MAFTGCAAGQGMVFDFSVPNSVYNFVRVCPNYKQGIFASTIDLISEMKFVCSPNIYKRYGFKIRQRAFNRVAGKPMAPSVLLITFYKKLSTTAILRRKYNDIQENIY